MTKSQYDKLVKNITHMEIDGNIYEISKRIMGNGPVLTAHLDNEGEVTTIEFSDEALRSGKIGEDGDVYIPEMGDSTDLEFWPLMLVNIFTGK